MVPPPALRKRLQQEAKGGASGSKLESVSGSRRVCGLHPVAAAAAAAVLAALAALLWAASWWLGGSGLLDDEAAGIGFEAAALLEQANRAIRHSYNYTLALEHLEKALVLAPRSASTRHVYASVLLSLDRVPEAWAQLRLVFQSRAQVARDPHLLQQYVLALHRLGKHEELRQVWPTVQRAPGIKWLSPLQCPELVDETLLSGAEPFPETTSLRVPELLMQHRDELLREFADFRSRPDWESTRYFRPNQDNDLVLGNEQGRWTELLLFDKGAWNRSGCEATLPTACRVLRGLRDVEGILHGKRSGQVSLLKLEEGAMLVPHFGTVNWRYTAHLGLLVPEGVVMHAGGESRNFTQGGVLLVDDSFLHSVEHHGKGPRVTFFVNFFHPRTRPLTHDEWLARDA